MQGYITVVPFTVKERGSAQSYRKRLLDKLDFVNHFFSTPSHQDRGFFDPPKGPLQMRTERVPPKQQSSEVKRSICEVLCYRSKQAVSRWHLTSRVFLVSVFVPTHI